MLLFEFYSYMILYETIIVETYISIYNKSNN